VIPEGEGVLVLLYVMVVMEYPVKECTVTDYFLKEFGMEKCSVIGLKYHVSMVVMKASVVYLTCSVEGIYGKIFYT